MVVKPRMSLNITVMSVFLGSTSCGLTSSRRITSGLRYCPNAERTRRFSFSSKSDRYSETSRTLVDSVKAGTKRFNHQKLSKAHKLIANIGTNSSSPNPIKHDEQSALKYPRGYPNKRIKRTACTHRL